jgi:hypothetical protein
VNNVNHCRYIGDNIQVQFLVGTCLPLASGTLLNLETLGTEQLDVGRIVAVPTMRDARAKNGDGPGDGLPQPWVWWLLQLH